MATKDSEVDGRRDGAKCPDCGSDISPSESANQEYICGECGRVIRESDRGRSALEDEEPAYNQTDLGPAPEWSEHYAVSNGTEAQVAIAFDLLETIGGELQLSREVLADAAAVYSSAAKRNLTRGRPLEESVAAAVHLAAQRIGEPRPLATVAETVPSRESTLVRATKLLRRELNEAHLGSRPSEYLPYLCQMFGVESVEGDARHLVECAESTGAVTGCSPPGIAAAALYLADDGDLTQREVARAAGVTTETIRVRLQDLRALNARAETGGEGGE